MRLSPITAVAATAFLARCAAPPILNDGPRYAALSPEAPVAVYMNETNIHQPYELLGTVTAMDLGKYQILTMQSSFPTLMRRRVRWAPMALSSTVINR